MVLVDGAPSTMTYLPTKFTIVLGRDDDVRHAGLWYMHLVRFRHGKFLIVSAADLQKHRRDCGVLCRYGHRLRGSEHY